VGEGREGRSEEKKWKGVSVRFAAWPS